MFNTENQNENIQIEEKPQPLIERLKSRVWKVRQDAFVELSALLEEGTDLEDLKGELEKEFHKFIADSNPGAQDKAIQALSIFIEKSGGQALDLKEVTTALVEKGYTAKGKVPALALQVLMDLFEKNDRNLISETLRQMLSLKNQKVFNFSYSVCFCFNFCHYRIA